MALGGWTFEFWDYYVVNITAKVDSPEIFAMAKVIDPKCKRIFLIYYL